MALYHRATVAFARSSHAARLFSTTHTAARPADQDEFKERARSRRVIRTDLLDSASAPRSHPIPEALPTQAAPPPPPPSPARPPPPSPRETPAVSASPVEKQPAVETAAPPSTPSQNLSETVSTAGKGSLDDIADFDALLKDYQAEFTQDSSTAPAPTPLPTRTRKPASSHDDSVAWAASKPSQDQSWRRTPRSGAPIQDNVEQLDADKSNPDRAEVVSRESNTDQEAPVAHSTRRRDKVVRRLTPRDEEKQKLAKVLVKRLQQRMAESSQETRGRTEEERRKLTRIKARKMATSYKMHDMPKAPEPMLPSAEQRLKKVLIRPPAEWVGISPETLAAVALPKGPLRLRNASQLKHDPWGWMHFRPKHRRQWRTEVAGGDYTRWNAHVPVPEELDALDEGAQMQLAARAAFLSLQSNTTVALQQKREVQEIYRKLVGANADIPSTPTYPKVMEIDYDTVVKRAMTPPETVEEKPDELWPVEKLTKEEFAELGVEDMWAEAEEQEGEGEYEGWEGQESGYEGDAASKSKGRVSAS